MPPSVQGKHHLSIHFVGPLKIVSFNTNISHSSKSFLDNPFIQEMDPMEVYLPLNKEYKLSTEYYGCGLIKVDLLHSISSNKCRHSICYPNYIELCVPLSRFICTAAFWSLSSILVSVCISIFLLFSPNCTPKATFAHWFIYSFQILEINPNCTLHSFNIVNSCTPLFMSSQPTKAPSIPDAILGSQPLLFLNIIFIAKISYLVKTLLCTTLPKVF